MNKRASGLEAIRNHQELNLGLPEGITYSELDFVEWDKYERSMRKLGWDVSVEENAEDYKYKVNCVLTRPVHTMAGRSTARGTEAFFVESRFNPFAQLMRSKIIEPEGFAPGWEAMLVDEEAIEGTFGSAGTKIRITFNGFTTQEDVERFWQLADISDNRSVVRRLLGRRAI